MSMSPLFGQSLHREEVDCFWGGASSSRRGGGWVVCGEGGGGVGLIFLFLRALFSSIGMVGRQKFGPLHLSGGVPCAAASGATSFLIDRVFVG